MPDFTVQEVDTGVGNYHFNRLRIAFRTSVPVQVLATNLFVNFPTYLENQYATVEWGDRGFNGNRTLHFHGFAKVLGIDLAKPHNDWVGVKWWDPKVGFTVQTLKREFFDAFEDVMASAGGGLSGAAAVHYNRMHFLAGRRSWRIGEGPIFGASRDVIILETIAVERFSAHVYDLADSVVDLETKLPDVWISLLNNFVRISGYPAVLQTPKPRWKDKNRVNYIQLTFDSLKALKADLEFVDAYKLYPTILPAGS